MSDRDTVAAPFAAALHDCGYYGRADLHPALLDSITVMAADVLAPLLAQARAEGARDALNAAAEWLTETGFPVDYSMGVHNMPEPFWQAVVDVIHEDKTGNWHGNTLDREETEDWLAGESGRIHFAAQHEEQP